MFGSAPNGISVICVALSRLNVSVHFVVCVCGGEIRINSKSNVLPRMGWEQKLFPPSDPALMAADTPPCGCGCLLFPCWCSGCGCGIGARVFARCC